ncbi:Uncharacterised protein [Mycobacterium tuberculosis]|uniref:Uncharacterized protein n=1 Tax=Mycobacterium tuberculosis TaxID=1773 RepID=A0A916PAG7_MYCTX|nr:Uncharacterised protein [Mycobacterium tuberculosis]CPC18943.1 Uncharacterised protein [Mycobacterium tuberculosis]
MTAVSALAARFARFIMRSCPSLSYAVSGLLLQRDIKGGGVHEGQHARPMMPPPLN